MTREELIIWHQGWASHYAHTSRLARGAYMAAPSNYEREDVDHFGGLSEMHAMTARELMGVNGNAMILSTTTVTFLEENK